MEAHEMSDFDRMRASIDIGVACATASRPDLVESAMQMLWNNGRTRAIQFVAEGLNNTVTDPDPAKPASASARSDGRSIFGPGPTPQQRDALAAAIKRRFEAETKRS